MKTDRNGRRSWWKVSSILLLFLGVSDPASSARQVLKIATLAPQGSIWDQALKSIGAEWAKETGGSGQLRVYAGGVAGDEADVLRKIRIGQFQGAGLTVAGLAELDPAFRLFHLPLYFRSYEELDAVVEELQPELDRRLESKGFVRLFWAHGGWVHLFSRSPVRSVEELKKQKLWVWAGDDSQVQQWRKNGFQPVALAATDIQMGLQTRLIDALPTTPGVALTLQWFRQAPHMLGLGLAPLVGAVVVDRKAWESLPERDRQILRESARRAEQRLAGQVPEYDRKAIQAMRDRGLAVVEPTPEEEVGWRRAAEAFLGAAREAAVPEEILARGRAVLERRRLAAAGGGL